MLKHDIFGLEIKELEDLFQALGYKKFLANQVFKWN